ncbi:hypothetical protein D9756_000385 [Leucocoprinus leucothites]|uniref:Uncharacterized protein n=1 Tax=Leucocoprinus leucothites TaxID=201217 RepID=A0A8H5GEN3_9AGAR|nr:hypothetical protein D9756_000385 [Leucoagaricus leucothites]
MPSFSSMFTASSDVTAHATFDDLVASYRMPPPGPNYFRARRQLWLTPRSDRGQKIKQSPVSSAQKRLVEILQAPEAVYSDSCWRNGIEKAWKGLSKGERLRHRLPLSLTIKVLQASWIRDDTWPAGMRAPESDDEVPEEPSPEPMVLERIDITKPIPELSILS